MAIDTALIGALHVEYLKKRDLGEGARTHHTLFQTSTVDALLDGEYDGDVSITELEDRGDFGLGTLEALDGEMIALDGGFYQVKADGRAYTVDGRVKTPFAVVTFFEPNLARSLVTPLDLGTFCAGLDRVVGGEASCYAIRADGHFEYVKSRSVPRQRKPYPPLAEVVKRQPTFEVHDVRGSLVGFRFPHYAQGLNVAGYHFHFITADRNAGGHVIEFRLARGELAVDRARRTCGSSFLPASTCPCPTRLRLRERRWTASRGSSEKKKSENASPRRWHSLGHGGCRITT